MMKKINLSILFLYLWLFSSCIKVTLSDQEITAQVWKCGQPCGLSDVLVFDKTHQTTIRNDTIVRSGLPIAKIVKRDFNRFTEDTKIHVINLQQTLENDTCVYHTK